MSGDINAIIFQSGSKFASISNYSILSFMISSPVLFFWLDTYSFSQFADFIACPIISTPLQWSKDQGASNWDGAWERHGAFKPTNEHCSKIILFLSFQSPRAFKSLWFCIFSFLLISTKPITWTCTTSYQLGMTLVPKGLKTNSVKLV